MESGVQPFHSDVRGDKFFLYGNWKLGFDDTYRGTVWLVEDFGVFLFVHILLYLSTFIHSIHIYPDLSVFV